MSLDFGHLYALHRETNSRLERLARLVAEGKELHTAADFARFVQFSGIPELLITSITSPLPEGIKCDGALLRWKAQELLRQVQEHWQNNPNGLKQQFTALDGINHKLDLIAGYMAKLHQRNPVTERNRKQRTAGHRRRKRPSKIIPMPKVAS